MADEAVEISGVVVAAADLSSTVAMTDDDTDDDGRPSWPRRVRRCLACREGRLLAEFKW